MNNNFPQQLLRIQRPVDTDFDPCEALYIRFDRILGNIVDPSCIRCPNTSVNRSKYSKDDQFYDHPEWVLLPRYPEFANWGYGSFTVIDIPAALPDQESPSEASPHKFKIEHDPLDDNYAHSEIRAYKGQNFTERVKRINNSKISLAFRVRLSTKIQILKPPVL